MIKRNPEYTAGEFRTPIKIERSTSTPDDSGGQSLIWGTSIPLIFCLMENKKGSEPYNDKSTGRVRTAQTFMFTMWYREDILQTDRINVGGLLFNIRQINNLDMRNKYLQIVAEAGVEQ